MITELVTNYLRCSSPRIRSDDAGRHQHLILGDPSLAPPAVVDPGPLDEDHLSALLSACRGQLAMIILTHGHADHAESAAELAGRADCDVRAADPALQIGRHGLIDRDAILLGGVVSRFSQPPATPATHARCCSAVKTTT